MSIQSSKIIRNLLLCLLIVGGFSAYNLYRESQQAQMLAEYRRATISEGRAVLEQTLRERGLVQFRGVVHNALLEEKQALQGKVEQCFPVNVDTSLVCEQAIVEVVDLHHCRKLSKDSDCRSGGQIVISLTNSEIDEIFISFHLLDAGQGDFTITIPEKESLQRELQQVFKQFVDEPKLAERHQLNDLMFRLFMNAKASESDQQLGQHFLKTLLGAVHHQLLAANVFR